MKIALRVIETSPQFLNIQVLWVDPRFTENRGTYNCSNGLGLFGRIEDTRGRILGRNVCLRSATSERVIPIRRGFFKGVFLTSLEEWVMRYDWDSHTDSPISVDYSFYDPNQMQDEEYIKDNWLEVLHEKIDSEHLKLQAFYSNGILYTQLEEISRELVEAVRNEEFEGITVSALEEGICVDTGCMAIPSEEASRYPIVSYVDYSRYCEAINLLRVVARKVEEKSPPTRLLPHSSDSLNVPLLKKEDFDIIML